MSNPVQDQDEDIIILGDTDDGLDIENSDILSTQGEKKEEILGNSENILSQNNETSIPLVSPVTEVSKEDNLFDFGIDENKNEVTQEIDSQAKANEENVFSGFDLDTKNQEQVVVSSQEQLKEELIQAQTPAQESVVNFLQEEKKEEENDFSFLQANSDTSSSSGTTSTQGDDDMNTILEATIQKLKARQIAISEEKDEKITQIDTRNDKIKTLKEEVSDLKDNVEALDTENQKIDANIATLEKMKLGEVNIIAEEGAKKRVARAKAV
ncbi:hypothetical protein HGA92_03190 [Candidatus Gracilibacteria bacterium]|nr:hypothetical protein [Candidatus Gracilibacteria bacterium]NUJ99110.1 hypothetical protein [Candidatus Gracilibacteria bacterium]